MTQHDLNRHLSDLTGESVGTIRQRGFNLVGARMWDPEERIVDWDAVDESHVSLSVYPIHWICRHRY